MGIECWLKQLCKRAENFLDGGWKQKHMLELWENAL